MLNPFSPHIQTPKNPPLQLLYRSLHKVPATVLQISHKASNNEKEKIRESISHLTTRKQRVLKVLDKQVYSTACLFFFPGV